MTYYPYFRGKQFELLAIRESAHLIAEAGITPIIEPVRESLNGLSRTLNALADADANCVVIVNPRHGDHRGNNENILTLLDGLSLGSDAIAKGILLKDETNADEAATLVRAHSRGNSFVIHSGFIDPRGLIEALGDQPLLSNHAFVEHQAGMLYRKHFQEGERVLIRDGFERKKNADYLPVDQFSDLHITYRDLGMDGFGDFLTVGDSYSEGGGPAYAVAIHLTFIDAIQDDAMFTYHFISDSNDTPIDPAGKFAQALEKLMVCLDAGASQLLDTSAVQEFRGLHARGHFPGLGYVKKLSIKHHLETMAEYQSRS